MDQVGVIFDDDLSRLNRLLDSPDVHIISRELNQLYQREDGPKVLQLFLRQLSNSRSSQEIRYKVSQVILKNVQENAVQFKTASKLISILSTEIESFTTCHLVELVNICMHMISNNSDDGYNCWKEVLPKLLNVLSEKEDVDYNGSRMTGLQYRSEIIMGLCANDWPETLITCIAAMFIEVTLSAEEHLKVVKKLCCSISHLQQDEIPPLTHQILQLTKSRHNVFLFIALNEYFNKKLYDVIEKNPSQVREIQDIKKIQINEGTVLYYIYSAACSLGPQIVKDFLKILKESPACFEFTLQPFFINLLLTISCISYNFEEEVTNILKCAISKAITEKEKTEESAWLNTIFPTEFHVENVLNKVLLKGFSERDKILKGMVNLGFALLNVPKSRGKESFYTRMWNIGNDILTKLIKNCSNVSTTIFQDLVNQISQAKESGQYTDCLSSIVRGTPLNLLNSSSAMIHLLDNICARTPGQAGQKVVASLLPLTKMSHSIRDNLIIVLRKSLFPHDETCRKMAVCGFLELLKGLKISNLRAFSQSISQNYCGLTQIYSESFVNSAPSHSNEGICLEILSVLREVFKHQHDVKVVFYKGIYDCVCANPELGNHVLDILQNQLEKFYRFGDDLPPLEFEKTIEIEGSDVVIQEPIAHLVLSTSLIVTKMNDESTRSLKLIEMLNSLCTRMAESDMCHFDLDRDDFSSDEVNNLFKQEKIKQILGIYEALMGYVLCNKKRDSINHGQLLTSLFKGYTRLSDYAKTLGKPDKKRDDKGKKQEKDEQREKKKDKASSFVFKPPCTVFNLKSASRFLSLLNENAVEWASETSIALVKGKRELHRYSLQVTLPLVKQAQNITATELWASSTTFGYFCKFGRILYKKSIQRLFESKEFDMSSTVLALECFSELLALILSRFKSKLLEFLVCTTENSAEKNVEEQLKIVIDKLLDQVEEILKDDFEEEEGKDDEQQGRKIVLFMVTIASALINQLPKKGSHIQEIFERLKHLCIETRIENPNTAKALMAFLLSANLKCKPSGSLLLDLAFNLCDKMKLIHKETTVESYSRYAIINAKTANVCLICICETCRNFLNEIEWVISRLRAELTILSLSNAEVAREKREFLLEKERDICSRINFYIKVLNTLCTIAVPPGIWSDALLKELGNVYSALTALTKYFIIKVGKYNQPLQNTRFEKTVRLVDDLSKNMYCFTEHVISDGAGNSKGGAEKAKKKDPNLLKNKILKETKIIPRVIYEKEQFNKFILQLSNKSKINLVGQTKQSMARDYRLTRQVKEILENEDGQNDENASQQDEDEVNEDEILPSSSSKRQRMLDD